jgi:outer membrane protein assembly factor BamB
MQATHRTYVRFRLSLALGFVFAVSTPSGSAEPLNQLEQSVLKHSLYRDADVVRKFQRGVAAQEQGELLQALTLYQSILAGQSDSIFWSIESAPGVGSSVNPLAASRTSFRSVRREVRQRLEDLIEAEPDLYERTQERQAEILLKEARESGDQATLEEVVRRFFETRAGFRAVEQLATQCLDQNSPEQAARLLRRLVTSRVHRKRISRSVIVKAGCALQLCGEHDAAQQLLQEAQQAGVAAAQLVGAEEAIAAATAAFQPKVRSTEWRTPYGDVTHNGAGDGTVPWLKPVWSQPYAEHDPFEALVNWERDRVSDELKEIGTASSSLVVNGQLIFRNFNGIRSVDPRSGKLLWQSDNTLSVPRIGRAIQTAFYAREDNRVAELASFGNAMLGQLTSDGERVFGVDLLSFVAIDFDSSTAPRGQREIEARNQLVALQIPDIDAEFTASSPRKPKIAWRVGGSPGPSPADPLAGHLFLGPPLPVGGVVFAVTESQRELCLAKLDAATGRVVWIQRFGLVEQSLFDDEQIHRAMASYLPAFADGLVICPTGSGLVVAIDALFGEIAWAAPCGDVAPSGFRGTSTTISKRPHGFSGFPGPPTVHGDAVVYLPKVSAQLHCFDLSTGDRVWKVPRLDALYVGSVTDQGILVIGQNRVRLLSLLDGHEIWAKGMPIPSGQGVRSGNSFMLPLKSGTVTVIDIATGKIESQAEQLEDRFQMTSESGPLPNPDEIDLAEFGLASLHVRSHLRPGNLLLHDGLVISTGPRHITVFRQAESLMQELYTKVATTDDVEAQVLTAQLELSTGRIDAAEKRLTELLKQGGISQHEAARRLLFRLLISQLDDPPKALTDSQRMHLLKTVESLAKSHDEKWQAFVESTRLDVDREDWNRAWPAVNRMTESEFTSFVHAGSGSATVVRTDVWGQSLAARMKAIRPNLGQGDPGDLDAFRKIRSGGTASLRTFLRLHAGSGLAGRVRNRLADKLIQEGSYQEAELLLIENRSQSTGESRAVAGLLLISLWDQLGLHGESGIALAKFAREFSDLPLPTIHEDTLTSLTKREGVRAVLDLRDSAPLDGRAMIDSFGESSQTRRVFEDLQPLPWRVDRVVVRKFSLDGTRPELGSTWTSGRVLNIGKRCGFDLLRRGNLNSTNWLLVGRYGGNERGSIAMPGRTSLPVPAQYRMIGHFMPVGSPARMMGVSLLEFGGHSPLWKHRFPRIPSDKLIQAGPATPSVCVFQTRKHLIGIHPGTGRVLWRKSDLEPDCGLYVEKEAGLFGDDEILILFHADQKTWTKLSTKTGETLGTGELDIEFRSPLKYVFGRKLLHIQVARDKGDDTRKRIRIWDPKTNEFDLDEPIDGRYFATRTPDNRLFAILNFEVHRDDNDRAITEPRLRIFQMPEARVISNVKLTPEQTEGISSLRLFADDNTLFVNTQRTVNTMAQVKYHYLASDSTLPAVPVQQGTLIALDRATGQELWSRHCLSRTFLALERTNLPFLVSLSRVRPRNRTNIHGIELEAVDRRTGEILGSHKQLIPDRFVHTRMNRKEGILQLFGLLSRVDIDFSRKTQRILLEQEPL